jgi:hypothetical protein
MTYWLSSSSIVQRVSESYRYSKPLHFASVLLSQQHHILTRNQAWQKHAMSVLFFLTARWLTQYSLSLTPLTNSNSSYTLDYCITFFYISKSLYLQSHSHPYTDMSHLSSARLIMLHIRIGFCGRYLKSSKNSWS